MSLEFPRLSGVCGFDLETFDPGLKTRGPGWAFPDGGCVVGFSVSWDEGRARHYYPIAHEAGGNYPADKCLLWLKNQMARTDIVWIMYNRQYDEGWLRRIGIPVRGTVYDAYTAVPLLDEYRHSYDLDSVGKDYLGESKDRAPLLEYGKRLGLKTIKAVMNELWRFPGDVVRPYAEQDAAMTLRLWYKLQPLLREQGLERVYQLESDLLPILIEMRWRGIRVDQDRAAIAAKKYEKAEAKIMKELRAEAGHPIEMWANDSLETAFTNLGIPFHRTPKTHQASFRAPWLMTQPHPFCQKLVAVRKLNKTRTTFLEGYILEKSVNGRIYPQQNPLPSEEGGAVTGRFSSSNPNMNNLPNVEKDPVNGKLVRGCMLPEEGEEWGALDYSQQEPRLMVHWAEDIRARGSVGAGDAYRLDPTMDFHQFMANLTGLPRKRAKNIFLGRAYGMGGAKYCHDVGLPTKWIERDGKPLEVAGEEGQSQLDQFDEFAPFVRILSKECERRAKRRSYIKTFSGRRCRFGTFGKDFYYKAMNRLIQGSAADQIKMAMVAWWKEGYVPMVSVYDELGLSVGDRETAHKAASIMETCMPLSVPCKVDIDFGKSWGEAA